MRASNIELLRIISMILIIIHHFSEYYDSMLLPLYAVLIVVLIFVIGMIVDYVRLAFIEKPVMKAITPSLERIQSRVEKVLPL